MIHVGADPNPDSGKTEEEGVEEMAQREKYCDAYLETWVCTPINHVKARCRSGSVNVIVITPSIRWEKLQKLLAQPA